MILAESLGSQFTISNGILISSDPDMVYFKRMKVALIKADIIKYVPMVIDETVVY